MGKKPSKPRTSPSKRKKAIPETIVEPKNVVPAGDAAGVMGRADSDEANRLELLALNSEASLSTYQVKEFTQRYHVKWIALVLCLSVIFMMSLMLWHMTHEMFWGPFVFINPALSVALVMGPIVSITSITIALLIGAFRKFEDGDMEAASSGALSAARVMR